MYNIDPTYPTLTALTNETRPSQITFHGLTEGRLKCFSLPEKLANLDDDRKKLVIKWFIQRYLKRYNGQCPFWGKVIGFEYSDYFICYSIIIDSETMVEMSRDELIKEFRGYVFIS